MTTQLRAQGLFEDDADHQGPVECLGLTFEDDDARRSYFLEKLREKLQDPEFRQIEGFPVGTDEDILALSDPPYYTACPNPFVGSFIAHYGKPYDPNVPYHREPFAADVSEGRSDPIYNAHSYHTKVPHKAIMRYILHYTEPGDIVFDGFCGTGMSGVAAQLCDDRKVVESMGYRVDGDGTIFVANENEQGKATWKHVSRLGARHAVLDDLSPAATFIAYNYNAPSVDGNEFAREAKRVLAKVNVECSWMYETIHPDGKATGHINYTLWSDVFTCPECTGEVVFWDVAVNRDAGQVLDVFACPHCGASLTKRAMDHVWVTIFDAAIKQVVTHAKQIPVLINYSVGNKRFEKAPDDADLARITKIANSDIPYWYPTDRMPAGDESRRNDAVGISHVHQFYTKRNLYVLAALRSSGLSSWLPFSALTPRATKMHRIAASRIGGEKKGVGGATVGVIAGTLYVPSLSIEMNVLDQARQRVDTVLRAAFIHKPITYNLTVEGGVSRGKNDRIVVL